MEHRLPWDSVAPTRKASYAELGWLYHYRWEFLRRNEKYRECYKNFRRKYEKRFGRQTAPWSFNWVSTVSYDQFVRSFVGWEAWRTGVEQEFHQLCGEWQVYYLADPAYCDCKRGKKWTSHNNWAFRNPMILALERGFAYVADPQNLSKLTIQVGIKNRIEANLDSLAKGITSIQKNLKAKGFKIERAPRGGSGQHFRKYVQRAPSTDGTLSRLYLKIRCTGSKTIILRQIRPHLKRAVKKAEQAGTLRPIHRTFHKKREGTYDFDLQVWDLRVGKDMGYLEILKRIDPNGYRTRSIRMGIRRRKYPNPAKQLGWSEDKVTRESGQSADPWRQKIVDAFKRAKWLVDGGYRKIS